MSDLESLMRTDPLAEAEKVTGKSYKEDEATSALGFLLHLANVEAKQRAAAASDDTHYSSSLEDTLRIYRELGFTELLLDRFEGSDGAPETYRILWHEDGILATVESYQTTHRNNTKIWYNVRFPDGAGWPVTSSGQYLDDHVWVGDHDMREGMRVKLAGLRGAGTFLPVWRKRPFLWLLTYMDSKVEGYDHKAITEERISRLPEHVQAAIAGTDA